MPAKGAIFTGPRAFPARGDLDSQNRRPPLRNALSKKVGGGRATRFMAQFVCCRGGGFQIANGRPQARPNGLNGRRRSCFSKCGSSARAARPIKVFGGRRGRRARRNYEESARETGEAVTWSKHERSPRGTSGNNSGRWRRKPRKRASIQPSTSSALTKQRWVSA